jgi:hypothetical protein
VQEHFKNFYNNNYKKNKMKTSSKTMNTTTKQWVKYQGPATGKSTFTAVNEDKIKALVPLITDVKDGNHGGQVVVATSKLWQEEVSSGCDVLWRQMEEAEQQ